MAEEKKEREIDNVSTIIAAITPDNYASSKCAALVKKLKKEGNFWTAVKKAELKELSAGSKYELSYNSSTESLEPVYFWLLDFITGMGLDAEKIVDNFISSPGSGHFSELMGKATRMQEESMKIMQTIGVLVKSVQGIIWDLKQFEIRLKEYKSVRSENNAESESGLMTLKQIWMDQVDIKKGNTSIKALTFSQASFATLIDAFMSVKSLKDIDALDLNERVKNILKQRYPEFEEWKKLSEEELKRRYNMEKAWLKSQVDSLKLYSRWAYPYLKAAEELRMSTNLSGDAALVKAFNTIIMQLTLFCKKKIKVGDSVLSKDLPPGFDKIAEKGKIRQFYSIVTVDFKFRGIPQRVEQHYGFGGKSDVTLRAYALNQEEYDLFTAKLGESAVKEAFKMVESATKSSLEEIEKDIEYFLKPEEEREKIRKKGLAEEENKKQEETENINPFGALIGLGTLWNAKEKKKDEKQEKEKEKLRLDELAKEIRPDNYYEKFVRKLAEFNAKKSAFTIYDIYKKAHGMAAVPFGDLLTKEDIVVKFRQAFKAG